MVSSISKVFLSGSLSIAIYAVCETKSYADNWACEVFLCLSNPGGPTEFGQCRPSIHKLWKHLAKGRSFPICRGIGFRASRPGYEPYYCEAGYRLRQRSGDRGREVTCMSLQPVPTGNDNCTRRWQDARRWQDRRQPGQWERAQGQRVCVAYRLKPPHVRQRPRFVDLTIDGAAPQRVWF